MGSGSLPVPKGRALAEGVASLGKPSNISGRGKDEVNVNDDDDNGEILEAPEEIVETQRHLPTPDMPSASDVEKHRETHCPYQSWCDECVEGRGREMGHRGVNHSERSIATVAFDYLFVNGRGFLTRDELEAAGGETCGVNILVVKDYKSN